MMLIPVGFLAVALLIAVIDQQKCKEEHDEIVKQLQREAMLEKERSETESFRVVLDREKLFREYCRKEIDL